MNNRTPFKIPGVGPDAPTVIAENGAKQSAQLFDMVNLPWKAIFAVAAVMNRSAKKYGVDNWRRIPPAESVNHAIVHLAAHCAPDTQEHHLANAACRVLFALDQYMEAHPEAYADLFVGGAKTTLLEAESILQRGLPPNIGPTDLAYLKES